MNASVQLEISDYYKHLLPRLADEDYRVLRQSLLQHGLKIPIDINSSGVILDGHHRYRLCLELRIPVQTRTLTFETHEEEELYVIDANLARRQLNDYQRIELVAKREPVEKKLAQLRMKAGKETLGGNFPQGRVREILAKAARTDPRTFVKGRLIMEKGSEETKEKLRAGRKSIHAAYREIRLAERHHDPPVAPSGTFEVLYGDPPWKYEIPQRGSPEEHYEVMETGEIEQYLNEQKIFVTADAILFLWATAPKLLDALAVMKAWGFDYKTHMVWVKDKIGTGYYFRNQHELLLVGKKGEMPPPTEATRVPSVLLSPRREHSRKPEEVFRLIESMYPGRKYLQLFARQSREGWVSLGKEMAKD